MSAVPPLARREVPGARREVPGQCRRASGASPHRQVVFTIPKRLRTYFRSALWTLEAICGTLSCQPGDLSPIRAGARRTGATGSGEQTEREPMNEFSKEFCK